MTSTILLKGEGIHKEAVAAGVVSPGHLIALNSSGAAVVNAVASKAVQPCFALEDELAGKDITDNYASGDKVKYVIPCRGSEIYALVPANASAIVIGDYLEADGTGCLRKLVGLTDNSGGTADTTLQSIGGTYTQAEVRNNFADLAAFVNAQKGGAIAIAMEAVDNSAGGTPARIKVEVL